MQIACMCLSSGKEWQKNSLNGLLEGLIDLRSEALFGFFPPNF